MVRHYGHSKIRSLLILAFSAPLAHPPKKDSERSGSADVCRKPQIFTGNRRFRRNPPKVQILVSHYSTAIGDLSCPRPNKWGGCTRIVKPLIPATEPPDPTRVSEGVSPCRVGKIACRSGKIRAHQLVCLWPSGPFSLGGLSGPFDHDMRYYLCDTAATA